MVIMDVLDPVALAKVAAVRRWCSGGGLRVLREDRGVSTYELAGSAGVSHSTLSRWERGAVVPSGVRALALFDAVEALAAVARR